MTEQNCVMGLETQMAVPLHLQRLERSLNVQPFLSQVNELFHDHVSDDDNSISSESSDGSNSYTNNELSHKEEEKVNKLRLYNMSKIGEERKWLEDILLSDSDTASLASDESDTDGPITEQDFQDMLKFHILRKKYQGKFYQKPENIQYQYYGAGLLSSYDRFPEHQKLIVGNKKKKEKKFEKKILKLKKEKIKIRNKLSDICHEHDYPEHKWDKMIPKEEVKEEVNEECKDDEEGEGFDYEEKDDEDDDDKEKDDEDDDDDDDDDEEEEDHEELDEAELEMMLKHQQKSRGRKKHNNKSPEMMAIRRRKIWIMMSKKELGKIQRAKVNNHKEMLINCKKLAQNCMKYWRQKAMQSQKNMKEIIWRAKRLTREMQSYWKRYDRVERETRRRLEKEAEEQRKMDVEMIEAKRQQRKLNFLITQTELYAHFMSRKLGKNSAEEQLRILNQLDEEKNARLVGIDDYDSELMKQKARKNAIEAFDHEKARAKQFDTATCSQEFRLSDTPDNMEHPQPSIFKGNLKGYQLKGMNWLANLYDQGISGILADEMGLGKTVQSIAFLCHIAERYSVWGPFLIISPASTLHNWQQEMARFVPLFKVVPYWGNPQERKILRQFWDTKDLHTKEASFHVVITSYQLVITDYKYFNRIKWQYMILDEAQAIKSTSSMRWKTLLGFSCRNRLLLSGTPIQNSMAELWALLHFIMPTLFDSHDEFNEWFSKDIESHAENKTGIDEKHLSRLHMILKPFMLRRIKKDVENELSDKIEVMVYCPLTTRQKLLYSALKQKIRIEDLLHYTVGGGDTATNDKNFTSNLMNLVMQFRKVCNHPELFERRDAKSPLFITTDAYQIPSLIYSDCLFNSSIPSKDHLLLNKLSIFNTEYIHRSLHPKKGENLTSFFAFSRFIDLSPMELYRIFIFGILYRLVHATLIEQKLKVKRYWEDWWVDEKIHEPTNFMLRIINKYHHLAQDDSDIIFTKKILDGEAFYTHSTHTIHSIPETMAHRILRSSKQFNDSLKSIRTLTKPQLEEETKFNLLPEHRHLPRPSIKRLYQPTTIPSFLSDNHPKVQANPRKLYISNSSAAWAWKKHETCGGSFGQYVLWMGCEQALRLMSLNQDYQDPSGVNVQNLRNSLTPMFSHEPLGGLSACKPVNGWSNIIIPDKQTLVTDAGKLSVLDNLLRRLKEQGHRVLIYSQMTKMIDLLEEYMYHRKHTFMRLDGSSKISDRRDMVADFQKRADIFVFLLSTRAGGLGINLTAADTVIFYDSDWNPTVDQQAMDRAHRLGQTKQVTVYRLICKGTIEERILQRAREKSEIQRMVISGGNFKPDTLKPKEVVSLLLDDEEIEAKYSQRSEERKQYTEETRLEASLHHKERDRKRKLTALPVKDNKKQRLEDNSAEKINHSCTSFVNNENANALEDMQALDNNEEYTGPNSPIKSEDETSNEGLIVDVDNPVLSTSLNSHSSRSMSEFSDQHSKVARINHHLSMSSPSGMRIRPTIRGTSKRGRPRGSRRGGSVIGKGRGLALQPPYTSNAGSQVSNSPMFPLSNDQVSQQGVSGNSVSEGDGTSTSSPPAPSGGIMGSVPGRGSPMSIRRGPGRPRLRPTGPGNQGHRIPGHHARRIQRPLPVPLRSTQLSGTPYKKVTTNAGEGASLVSPMSIQMASSVSTFSKPAETRPFGFYTQQQTSSSKDEVQNEKQ
ncbi:chromatin-remodeling ATPase INO80 [Chelonus insularis]|uniref:chromatin-remodeling ATPase INO80 n=1 Tax=Chelonus insularis TaxID=460826 RepID=UPI0015889DB8|nr:chromatin-remodeling ATPase INO80 [Chelonus insularis]XP_034946861.1 chromatin-remodeling ATPase INO80 [Chelonus insularis]